VGHHCRICGRTKPNEAFSGKGHRIHLCKKCSRLPKAEREAIVEPEEILGYLNRQSHISSSNVARLEILSASPNQRTAELASLVLEVARLTPYRRRRQKLLAKGHHDLYGKLKEAGLLPAHEDGPIDAEANPFAAEADLIMTVDGWPFNFETEEAERVCADYYFWSIDGDDEDGR